LEHHLLLLVNLVLFLKNRQLFRFRVLLNIRSVGVVLAWVRNRGRHLRLVGLEMRQRLLTLGN